MDTTLLIITDLHNLSMEEFQSSMEVPRQWYVGITHPSNSLSLLSKASSHQGSLKLFNFLLLKTDQVNNIDCQFLVAHKKKLLAFVLQSLVSVLGIGIYENANIILNNPFYLVFKIRGFIFQADIRFNNNIMLLGIEMGHFCCTLEIENKLIISRVGKKFHISDIFGWSFCRWSNEAINYKLLNCLHSWHALI